MVASFRDNSRKSLLKYVSCSVNNSAGVSFRENFPVSDIKTFIRNVSRSINLGDVAEHKPRRAERPRRELYRSQSRVALVVLKMKHLLGLFASIKTET